MCIFKLNKIQSPTTKLDKKQDHITINLHTIHQKMEHFKIVNRDNIDNLIDTIFHRSIKQPTMPLHRAAYNGDCVEIERILASNIINPSDLDEFGSSAYWYACLTNHREAAEMLCTGITKKQKKSHLKQNKMNSTSFCGCDCRGSKMSVCCLSFVHPVKQAKFCLYGCCLLFFVDTICIANRCC